MRQLRDMRRLQRRRRRPGIGLLAAVAGVAMVASACGSGASSSPNAPSGGSGLRSLAGTTITLEGPNQWNGSGSSFGAPWDRLVASFKKVTGITVKTTVLPLASFAQVEATHLGAGDASDLIFDQAPHQNYQIRSLTPYLEKPNPFIPGNKRWISVFKPEFYGLHNSHSIESNGDVYFVPFNLVSVGFYFNEDAFKKAGIASPGNTFQQFLKSCQKLKAAGYTPLAMDDSADGVGWTDLSIFNQLAVAEGIYKKLNYYNANGERGSNPELTTEDITRGIALGLLKASDPAVVETLKLMKQFFDSCVSSSWTGVPGLSGAVIGQQAFLSQKAAIAWGGDFSYGSLKPSFKLGSGVFPTITPATTPLSKNVPAEFGASTGGTSYMIPSKITGKQLQAAIRFLQFVSTPKYVQPWLTATGGSSVLKGARSPAATAAFSSGNWGRTPQVGFMPGGPPTVTTESLFDTYLLGDKSLKNEISSLQSQWIAGAAYNIKTDNWQSQPWASKVPSS